MYPKEGKEHLFQQLQSIGWSQVALEQVFAEISVQGKTVSEERDYLQEAQLFGSPFFQDLWLAEDAQNSRLGVQELLVLAMNIVNMPEELSGDKSETDFLLARIAFGKFSQGPCAKLFQQMISAKGMAIKSLKGSYISFAMSFPASRPSGSEITTVRLV